MVILLVTVDDLTAINNALNKGEDVIIRRTGDGVKITANTVRVIKKKSDRVMPKR